MSLQLTYSLVSGLLVTRPSRLQKKVSLPYPGGVIFSLLWLNEKAFGGLKHYNEWGFPFRFTCEWLQLAKAPRYSC
jgi:hypothetical protein